MMAKVLFSREVDENSQLQATPSNYFTTKYRLRIFNLQDFQTTSVDSSDHVLRAIKNSRFVNRDRVEGYFGNLTEL